MLADEPQLISDCLGRAWNSKPWNAGNRPTDGELLGWIDLTRINPSFNPSRYSDDVLNGIAWDSVNDKLWVTGKLWSQMYEIDLKIK
jgi:glutamine cyclotransferase